MSSSPAAAHSLAADTHATPHRRLIVVLLVTASLVLGFGVGTLIFRRPAPSNFSGAPSVTSLDLPARAPASMMPAAAQPAAIEEPRTARAALQQFLDSEIGLRSEVSFALLDSATRRSASTVAGWESDRATRLLPERFTIGSERQVDGATELTVLAERTPAVTPVTGLVPGRSEEVWRVVRETGWRISGGRPVRVLPVLPAEAKVRPTAADWLDRAGACGSEGSVALQLSKSLLGAPSLVDVACDPEQDLAVGDVLEVSELPDLAVFVSAYGPAVGRWARAVSVTGSSHFVIVLAPLGDDWRVMGLVPDGSPRP